ncbi:hypothetical protein SS50377_20631 [Spironucleus salmonicida]|uniref:Uncharacterized protein n=1 Tax=Spironucleus salmonicida TaxID=348837 RepID=A0A9P8S1S3_9EUKA|nr:hypothetical protein SS50377_20631 [Spironucleus salmonicida]
MGIQLSAISQADNHLLAQDTNAIRRQYYNNANSATSVAQKYEKKQQANSDRAPTSIRLQLRQNQNIYELHASSQKSLSRLQNVLQHNLLNNSD